MEKVNLPPSIRGDGTLVSVIIPTYGDDEFLPKAFDSVCSQTHDNIQIVIVDSSGVDWLESLPQKVEGIRYVYQEPSGLAAARNRGIEESDGEVIALLDADDYWAPKKLERQLSEIEHGADVVYCDAFIVSGDDQRRMTTLPITDPQRHWLDFLYEGGVPVPTVIARQRCFEAERFDERLDAVEDRHLLARLFREFTPERVPEPLAYYRRRSESMSSDPEFMLENELRCLRYLSERYPELDEHEEYLRAKAQYKHAKRLLRGGRGAEARQALITSIRQGFVDPRAVALLPISFLPVYTRAALETLERVQEALR